jgi:CDP-glycerol glycerophosphotransferase (TagB/SpsB family)
MDFADYLNSRRITQDQMINDQDTYHLIHHSDIVVGDFSTGVFEAAALQKPVIQLYQPDQDKSHLKLKHAATETELIEVINQLRFNSQFYKHFISDQNKVIEELFHKIQGSAERIAEYICKLL